MTQEQNSFQQMRLQLKWRLLNTTQIVGAITSNDEDKLRGVFTDAILTSDNLGFLEEFALSLIDLEVIAVHYCKRCACLEIYFRVISDNEFWDSNLLQFDVIIEDNGLMMISGMAVHEIPDRDTTAIEAAVGGRLAIHPEDDIEEYHEVKVSLRVPCRNNNAQN
jgi:hypothetical protein